MAHCPVCRESIGTCRSQLCGSCDTPHHADCWSFNGGCAIYGCSRPPAEVGFGALGWLVMLAMAGFEPIMRLMEVASDRLAIHVERQLGRRG